jgi:hypothetical protein
MNARDISRRTLLKSLGAAGLTLAFDALPLRAGDTPVRGNGVVAYRRSSRGCRASNAVKKHNANHLYKTRRAAEGDLAHPGDPSRVVTVTLPRDLHAALFANDRDQVDLRRVRLPRV